MQATKEQDGTRQNSERGTVEGQTKPLSSGKVVRHLSKTHQDHWYSRLRKRGYLDRSGQFVEVPNWQIRLKKSGRESWFNLGTPNQAAAAKKAKEIFTFLEANGWETALAKYKPKGPDQEGGVTVGEFLGQVQAAGGLAPGTFAIYGRKFRTLVSGAFGIKGDDTKHDYVNGGYQKWVDKVHSVKLGKLTPERVNSWKVRQLKAASRDPLSLKHKGVTVRSILLSSKALFSPKVTKHLNLKLPAPLPFEGVALPEIGKSRYKSEIDPAVILTAAKRELEDGDVGKGKPKNPRPELFKIVLLALGAGLRRDEIDTLTWKQILWGKNQIRVETTEFGGTKSHDSENDVDVDPGLLEILKAYMPKPGHGSPFVIRSRIKPRPSATTYHHYRCDRLFKDTIKWLRGKGVETRNALHSLRKEFGSQICRQAGIYAASVALRHSGISITRDYYIEKKQPAFLAITRLMQQPTKESEEPAEAI